MITRNGRASYPIYIGGPLDGRPAERSGTQWSIYRDDEGFPISSTKGDREWMRTNRGLPVRRFYTRQHVRHTQGAGLVEVYVHASAWDFFNEH